MEQRHPVTLTHLKQNLPDNLALAARIVPSSMHPLNAIPMRAGCTGKRLFDTQIVLRFGSETGWWGFVVHASWMQLAAAPL
jgi:hypothetical protein